MEDEGSRFEVAESDEDEDILGEQDNICLCK